MDRLKIGLIGCGHISGIYLESNQKFDIYDIVACADLNMDAARAAADKFNIEKVYTVEELLADPEIDIVLNLTIPQAHAEIALAALEHGKHVYSEKPLAVTLEDGKKVLDKAKEKGLRIGGAPDTFLGGSLQTCRKLIDDGWIGEPIGATAYMMNRGPEAFHPNPDFFFKAGGGPMFDMGPYYLTALVNMIGSVQSVTGSTNITFSERTIKSQPKYGQKINVEIPTHVNGVLNFANGAIGNIITSFDVWGTKLPNMEIYGTEGVMSVPDPNYFSGKIEVKRHMGEWQEVPLTHGFTDNSRGIGLADMAYAIKNDRNHRASGQLTYHVLEVMHAIHQSSHDEKHIHLSSSCERPSALPIDISIDRLELLNHR
ncbi:Gfo/Idh/MocA family oxidoreductase [Gracilibacillus sp. YIM 98692]|uniref:Gfo/Idh/MocA family protein n=1 Tax=Gracilibacillus sp. YIM 98692 TaxID=2663532 RepID=UPI0013D70022|nr:Gfo/Idh/MocA family oxidoreductase [Gracilibacillus sp. YIM 98692]